MKRPNEQQLARLRPGVSQKLGFYVYAYVDPRNNSIIYVGKGKKDRALKHLSGASNDKLAKYIADLEKSGLKPRIDILAHGLRDEAEAAAIETAVIDAVGFDQLTNEIRGGGAVIRGRSTLSELDLRYGATPIIISEPSMLIRINKLYFQDVNPEQLYEATRGVWKVSPRRARNAKYAFAVFLGVIYGVFEIDEWHSAATTPYQTRSLEDVSVPGRWEFTGRYAKPEICLRYVGYSVADYFPKGQQNPIRYIKV